MVLGAISFYSLNSDCRGTDSEYHTEGRTRVELSQHFGALSLMLFHLPR